jgi:hypothetical protein
MKSQATTTLTFTASCVPQLGSGLVDDPTNPNDETLFGGTIKAEGYWSGTEYAPDTTDNDAWLFSTHELTAGDQYYASRYLGYDAWVVRPGRADAPEPGSLLLLTAGLAGLGWSRRHVRRKEPVA